MRKAALATSVGDEMKIRSSCRRSAASPSIGCSASAHQPRSSPSQRSKLMSTMTVPRMARSSWKKMFPGGAPGHTRPPPPDPPLEPIEQRDRDQARHHEDEDAEEYEVGLERVAGGRDHVADAGRGS